MDYKRFTIENDVQIVACALSEKSKRSIQIHHYDSSLSLVKIQLNSRHSFSLDLERMLRTLRK